LKTSQSSRLSVPANWAWGVAHQESSDRLCIG
jgi:hypothetical protein